MLLEVDVWVSDAIKTKTNKRTFLKENARTRRTNHYKDSRQMHAFLWIYALQQ